MIRTLFVGSVSACFETDNDYAYYNDSEYTVRLDGNELFTAKTNVFSLFDLLPDKEYELAVTGHEPVKFRTASETCAVSVKDFGAAGDGVTDDTQSIQTAVNCLPAGGRLYFPEGVYYTAPISLKSHITLELAEKAVLLGHTEQSRYPLIPGELTDIVTGESVHFGAWEGNAVPMHQAFLSAEYAEDIRIVGRGTVDGNAQNGGWWINVKERTIPRPRLIFFNRCSNITVHGITGQNAASWQFHPYFSENLNFLDLSVNAPKDSPNTDAMDPEACDNVNIIGCRFSVGDDCIAIKSGKIELGRKYKRPASRHTIRNCIMQSGHGAITLGSEMAGGVKDLPQAAGGVKDLPQAAGGVKNHQAGIAGATETARTARATATLAETHLIFNAIPTLSIGDTRQGGVFLSLSRGRLGGYLSARANFVSQLYAYECLSDGTTPGPETFNGNGGQRIGEYSFSAGAVINATPWLGVFAGAGFGSSTLCWSDFRGTWARIKDYSASGLLVEGGLILHYRHLSLLGGVSWLTARPSSGPFMPVFTLGAGIRF